MSTVSTLAKVRDVVLGRSFELTLVKNYVSRWGMAQAVRELIQNSIDSQSPFSYEFVGNDGKWTLCLRSEFATLTPRMLLLGATDKAEDEDAIGSFGEGFKIALLVLTRLGYDVDVLNGEVLWKPRFRYSRAFGDEILAIDETHLDRPNKGLTFLVHGLDASEVEQVEASCLLMQDAVGEVKATEYGDILVGRPGKLYVGSLHVCDTELRFGYDVKPRHLRLDRDRQTVDSFDLKMMTLKMWFATGENSRVAQMISDQVPDVEYAEYGAPELVREECYRIFRENNPGALIASSPEDMRKKIEAGMTRTVYVGGGMYGAVSASASYQRERVILERPRVAPAAVLAKFLTDHRGDMRRPAIVAMKALIERAKRWEAK